MTDRPVRRGRWGELIPEPKEGEGWDLPLSAERETAAVLLDDEPSGSSRAHASSRPLESAQASEKAAHRPAVFGAMEDASEEEETRQARGRRTRSRLGRIKDAAAESPEETFKRGLRTASEMLSRTEYPPGALRRKLREKGFAGAVIEDILDRLSGAGLLNEDKMAARRAEYLHRVKHYGPMRIERELIRLGFSEEAAGGVDLTGEDFDFEAKALLILQKSHYEEAAPAIRRLLSYGYSLSMAKKAWQSYQALQEETEE